MRKYLNTKALWLVLATLGAFAALVPTASADTALPVWSCRASAGYVELGPLLGNRRVEPVLANGFPDRVNPDTGQCASADTGVQDVNLPPGDAGPLIELNGAYATTRISPEVAPAREQTVSASGGVTNPLRIIVAGVTITANVVAADAGGSCSNTVPQFTGTSRVVDLRINGLLVEVPDNGQAVTLDLSPIVRINFNQQIRTGNATATDEALTQRAAHIEILPTLLPDAEPLARVIIGEAKVDRHGAVCAPPPPPPPPPSCPAGTVPQNPGGNPLTCIRIVTAPCPSGFTEIAGGACVLQVVGPCPPDATRSPSGACIATPAVCPAGTTRDPASAACILLVQGPCPAGTKPEPATRVCVREVVRTTGSSGENGRVGGPDGPRATCGRLAMRFVRGGRRTLTNTFGTRVVTRGKLVTCGSNPRPIVGARVDVVHVLPGEKARRKTGLRSRFGGLLTLILPLDLRSRRIEYAYRPNLNTRRITSKVTLRLTVRSRSGGRVLR